MNARAPSFPSRCFRNVVLAAAAAIALPSAAFATWSIVLIDKNTGEVAIGCATCLEGLDLEVYVPVMLTGVGGACAQSSIDSNGHNRRLIWDELLKGTAPKDILTLLRNSDPSHQSRQYGIVDLLSRRATFTGRNCGAWAGGVVGSVDSIAYAIQGNVLTGQPVVDAAQTAVIGTVGDLAEKLMAAMEAAHDYGGDGRCSCDPNDPDRCGSPPGGWDPDTGKSAHIGFMMVSRIGDIDGDCNAGVGCANGSYYMNLNIANQHQSDPDPVVQLREKFDEWRDSWRGRPDHVLSTATLSRKRVPGNGTRPVTLTIVLNDWENHPVGHGGAAVTVEHSVDSAGLSTIGTPVDNGDGSYTVEITAGAGQGIDEFEIVADDGLGPVTLYPFPTLTLDDTLKSDATSISAAAGGTVNFDLTGPEDTPPPLYLLLGSSSGTTPGMDLGGVIVPLNLDDVVILSYELRNTTTLVNTDGVLLPDGSASAQLVAEPDEFDPIIGWQLAFAFFTHDPVTFASNPVLLTIDP